MMNVRILWCTCVHISFVYVVWECATFMLSMGITFCDVKIIWIFADVAYVKHINKWDMSSNLIICIYSKKGKNTFFYLRWRIFCIYAFIAFDVLLYASNHILHFFAFFALMHFLHLMHFFSPNTTEVVFGLRFVSSLRVVEFAHA